MIRMKFIRKLSRIFKSFYYIISLRNTFKCQIDTLKKLPGSPFSTSPENGFLRGIDYYSEAELIRILSLTAAQYRQAHGRLPDLVHPTGFNEKILWSKFFAALKVPESGNKLLTSRFIPDDIRHLIACPAIHWRSSSPRLPRNHEIKPGFYYVKATHGSGMYKRVRYPLDDTSLAALEAQCAKWLRKPYGLEKGEWWYNLFEREIIVDEDVAQSPRSIAYDFFVFRGKVEHIMLHRKGDSRHGEPDEVTRLDAAFRPLDPSQQSHRPPVRFEPLPEDTMRNMRKCAERIGSGFPFARVDLLLGKDGKLYLAELTFSPANGLAKRPVELDTWLGEKWIL
jgi:hypothetical protein